MKSSTAASNRNKKSATDMMNQEEEEEVALLSPKLSALLNYFQSLEAAIDRIEKRLTTVEGRCAQFQAFIRRNTKTTTTKATSTFPSSSTSSRASSSRKDVTTGESSNSGVLTSLLDEIASSQPDGRDAEELLEDDDDHDDDDNDHDVTVISKHTTTIGSTIIVCDKESNLVATNKDQPLDESPRDDVEPGIFKDIVEELTTTLLEPKPAVQQPEGSSKPKGRATRCSKAAEASQSTENSLPKQTSKKATTTIAVNADKQDDIGAKRVTRRRSKTQTIPKNSISVLDIIEDEDESASDASVSDNVESDEEDGLSLTSEDEMEDANQRMAKRKAKLLSKATSASTRPKRASRVVAEKQEETPSKLKRRAALGVNYLETSSEEEEFHTDVEEGNGEKIDTTLAKNKSTTKAKKTVSKIEDGDDGGSIKSEVLIVSKAIPMTDAEKLICRRPNPVEKKILTITRSPCYMCRYYHKKASPNACSLMCTGCTNRFGFQLTICNDEACWEKHLQHICNEQVSKQSQKKELQDIINHHYNSRFKIETFDFDTLKQDLQQSTANINPNVEEGEEAAILPTASVAIEVEDSGRRVSRSRRSVDSTDTSLVVATATATATATSVNKTPTKTAKKSKPDEVLTNEKEKPSLMDVQLNDVIAVADPPAILRGKRGRRPSSSTSTSVAESPALVSKKSQQEESELSTSEPVSKEVTTHTRKRTRK